MNEDNNPIQPPINPNDISPVPQSPRLTPKTMSFPQAIAEVIDGKRIARQEWCSLGGETDYGFLKDGVLQIFTNNKFHQWIINDGDLNADDWFSLPAIGTNIN